MDALRAGNLRHRWTLASDCRPFLFHAAKIEGDGGYIPNPALFALIYSCESREIVASTSIRSIVISCREPQRKP
jgi:hypothetical protein